jgi:hypothetical protein
VTGFSFDVPDDLVEAIARRSAEITVERLRGEWAPRWLTGAQAAADYLGWPVKRVHNRIGELPHFRNGGALMFSTADLDRYVAGQKPTG